MGFVTGLKAVQEIEDARPKHEDFEDRVPAKWLSLKGGESVKMTPLQEIDEGSPNYDKELGLAIFSLQHSGEGANWKKNAECTIDEGDCYGCAQGWYQKTVLYINVLVDDGKNDPYVAIFSRGLGKNSVATELRDMAGDEDFNYSVSDKTFKFSRKGSTKDDTTYALKELTSAKAPDKSQYKDQLFDLPKYTFKVKPEHQEAYYNGQPFGKKAEAEAAAAPAKEAVPATAEAVDNDW
jgi:hypothetical protein